MSKQLKKVTIYTDGACQGNPGPGGYGAVLIYGKHRKEISGGYRLTTNNRMEIMAVIRGLSSLKDKCDVTLYSDSKYVCDTIMLGWAKRWRSKGWYRGKTKGKKALNSDLWQQVLDLCDQHNIEFVWVRGHAGNPENERCDELAVEASEQGNLPADQGYEAVV